MTTTTAPRLARLYAIEEGAGAFFRFARRQGVRFDLAEKIREAVTFSAEAGGSTFAFPTKLSGTGKAQEALAALAAVPHRFRELTPRVVPDTRPGREGRDRVALYFGGDRLGSVQDKHLTWLLPMTNGDNLHRFAGTGLGFYVLQVTGGQPGRPTRGLNVVITGAGERARLLLERAARNHYEAEATAEREMEEREVEEAAAIY